MKYIAVALGLLIASNTGAQADTTWKETALEKLPQVYPRIKDASWSDSGSLWLFAYDADVSWEVVTRGLLCLELTKAGKPDGKKVLVSWFDNAEALQGRSKRIAQVWCE